MNKPYSKRNKVSTPTISFSSDPNTGMYSPGPNTIGFSVGGSGIGSFVLAASTNNLELELCFIKEEGIVWKIKELNEVIDDIPLIYFKDNDLILLKEQDNPIYNGVYMVFQELSTFNQEFKIIRNSYQNNQIMIPHAASIELGKTNKDTIWLLEEDCEIVDEVPNNWKLKVEN